MSVGCYSQQGPGISGRHRGVSEARSSQGRGLGSEESLQDVKQENLRGDVYVRSLTLVPVSLQFPHLKNRDDTTAGADVRLK